MRLLVDCHFFDSKYGGVNTYIEGLYSRMISHKDIDFYFTARDTEALKLKFGEHDNVHFVRLASKHGLIRLCFEFPKLIKKLKIDYAHFQYISPLKKRCKEIVTLHDLLFLDFPQYFPFLFRLNKGILFKRSAIRADLLLTVSEFSREEIVKHYGIPKEQIHITPNAAILADKDTGCSDVLKRCDLSKYILSVGRIEPRKNYHNILEAFVELNLYKKGYKLVFVGQPDIQYTQFEDYFAALPNEVKASVIRDKFTFPELITLYRNASLFVFASFAEGFGIPPLEAIEYGCPVLCSNTTAMKDFHLPDDWSFSPSDKEELKEKMLRILEHRPDLNVERMRLAQIFNWGKIADEYYSILKQNSSC